MRYLQDTKENVFIYLSIYGLLNYAVINSDYSVE
jgi:hypothetical protein